MLTTASILMFCCIQPLRMCRAVLVFVLANLHQVKKLSLSPLTESQPGTAYAHAWHAAV